MAPPFWANTQLLWYRKSVAEAAGVDPTGADFTWDEMIKAAESQGKRIGVQGAALRGLHGVDQRADRLRRRGDHRERRARGRRDADRRRPRRATRPPRSSATLARSSAAPADMSTAGEEEARSPFQGDDGSFMVNWPYVYKRRTRSREEGALDQSVVDDIALGPLPAGDAGQPSTPPLGGINLAIGAFTKHP